MQASALLLRWGSYRWAGNLWVLIVCLFFLPVMLPSVLPKLGTDLAVRVFPGVWKLLSFLRLPSRDVTPSLPLLSLFFVFCVFSYLLLKTVGCFSGCLMSSGICGGESGLPILFLHHLRTAFSTVPRIYFLIVLKAYFLIVL